MKIRNLHQASVFLLKDAKALNCGIMNGVVWIEFEENELFKKLMKQWQNKEFI